MSVNKVRGPRVKRLAMISPSDTSVTNQEIALAKEHFNKFDTENRGSIDIEELPSLLREIGFYMEKDRLDKYYLMFFGYGLNTMDPVLSWERFLLLYSMLMRNQLPVIFIQIFRLRLVSKTQEANYIKFAQRALEDAINIFTEFDADGSGALDQKELKVLLESLGTKPNINIQKFVDDKLFKIDKNQDEKIDFDEFVDFYNDLMDLI